MDETSCSESMTLKTLNKINGKLMFFYCKNKFLTPTLCIMLWNALMLSYFDCACFAWNTNLNQKLKKKIQITQNNWLYFWLKLDKRHHIYSKHFQSSNWLPVYKRMHQCTDAITFEFVDNACPYYLNEI